MYLIRRSNLFYGNKYVEKNPSLGTTNTNESGLVNYYYIRLFVIATFG